MTTTKSSRNAMRQQTDNHNGELSDRVIDAVTDTLTEYTDTHTCLSRIYARQASVAAASAHQLAIAVYPHQLIVVLVARLIELAHRDKLI